MRNSQSDNLQENLQIGSLDAVMAWNAPVMAALGQASEACTQAWLEWQDEMTRFVNARLEENRRTRASFGECQTMSELARLQQEWSRNAIKAYIDEFGRLPQIAARFFQNGIQAQADAQSGAVEHTRRAAE